MPTPALWYHRGSPAGSFAGVCATRLRAQMSFSFVFVPESSPRETKFARPAAPARAIASNAETPSWRAGRRGPPRALAGPPITKTFHMTVRATRAEQKPPPPQPPPRGGGGAEGEAPPPPPAVRVR